MINGVCYGALYLKVREFLCFAPYNCSFELLDTDLYQQAHILEQTRFNPGLQPPALKSVMAMRDSLGLLLTEDNSPIGYVVGMDLSSCNRRNGSKQAPQDANTFFVYDLCVVKSDPLKELNVCDCILEKMEKLLCVPYKIGGRGADRDYDSLMIVLLESPKNQGLFQMLYDAGYTRKEKRQNGSKVLEFTTELDRDMDCEEEFELD